MDLTEAQWNLIEPLLAMPAQGRGRPYVPARDVVNGIMWVLRTGAPWADLPDRYPPYQTCHRRFQTWCRQGAFQEVLRVLAQDLEERGGIDMSECYVDGTFAPAKKGAMELVRQSAAKALASNKDHDGRRIAFGHRLELPALEGYIAQIREYHGMAPARFFGANKYVN